VPERIPDRSGTNAFLGHVVQEHVIVSRAGVLMACLVLGCLGAAGAQQGSGAQTRSAMEAVLDSIKKDPVLVERRVDGCVRLHHLWKAQLRAHAGPAGDREKALREDVFLPNQKFWTAYLGDEAAFTAWVRASKPLVDDPRLEVPIRADIGTALAETTRRLEQLVGQRACGDWFIVYGPGWTNMGGLGSERMVLDILGLPVSDPVGDIRFALPHELNHLLFDKRRGQAGRGTLLHRILDEGFAAFVADEYWGVGLSAPEALGYAEAEWTWAVDHEQALWQEARPHLTSKDRKVLDTFFSSRRHGVAGAPGKVGYFLGYRIVEDFVRRNGAKSWRKLYDLPLEDIVSATRFAWPESAPSPK
jgi:hypothetical protein